MNKVKVRVLKEINWFKPWDEIFMLEWNLKYFIWKVEIIEEKKTIKKAKNKAILESKENK